MLAQKNAHLQLAPLGQEHDVVRRLPAHVEQRLAPLTHPDRVRAFRVTARKTLPEADVQKPELNSLPRFSTK